MSDGEKILEHEEAWQRVQTVLSDAQKVIIDGTEGIDSKQRWLIVSRVVASLYSNHFGLSYYPVANQLIKDIVDIEPKLAESEARKDGREA